MALPYAKRHSTPRNEYNELRRSTRRLLQTRSAARSSPKVIFVERIASTRVIDESQPRWPRGGRGKIEPAAGCLRVTPPSAEEHIMGHVVIGTGSYLPEWVLTNKDIEATVTDFDPVRARASSLDEWARRQHGAISRHRVRPGEGTADMATEAAKRAMTDAGITASDIDLIVMATFSNDFRLPQVAGQVQANLGSKAKFLQIDSACTGFLDAMFVAPSLMQIHGFGTALVIGADVMSYYTDPKKFMPSTVFGDGAGAVILHQQDRTDGCGVGKFHMGSEGDVGDFAWAPGGVMAGPFRQEPLGEGPYIQYKFTSIFPWAVDRMAVAAKEAMARTAIKTSDVDWVLPHQASVNLVREVSKRLEIPDEKVILTYPYTGNTSAASIPIALDDANRRGLFSHGDWLVFTAGGAGMAWGAMTLRWYDYRSRRG